MNRKSKGMLLDQFQVKTKTKTKTKRKKRTSGIGVERAFKTMRRKIINGLFQWSKIHNSAFGKEAHIYKKTVPGEILHSKATKLASMCSYRQTCGKFEMTAGE
jgi:hypothetical protein